MARKPATYKFKLTAVAFANKAAHRLRADDARRRIRRAAGRGLKKGLPRKEFRRRAIRIEGDQGVM